MTPGLWGLTLRQGPCLSSPLHLPYPNSCPSPLRCLYVPALWLLNICFSWKTSSHPMAPHFCTQLPRHSHHLDPPGLRASVFLIGLITWRTGPSSFPSFQSPSKALPSSRITLKWRWLTIYCHGVKITHLSSPFWYSGVLVPAPIKPTAIPEWWLVRKVRYTGCNTHLKTTSSFRTPSPTWITSPLSLNTWQTR